MDLIHMQFLNSIYIFPPQVCHLLIEWGCDVHLKNMRGLTAIDSCRSDELKFFMIEQYEFYSTVVPKIMDGDLDLLREVIQNHKTGVKK